MSNIERGTERVSDKKIDIYCRKLGFGIKDLPHLILEDEYASTQQKNKLLSIERISELLDPQITLKLVEAVEIDPENPLQILVNYIKGRCYYHQKKWGCASNAFHHSIRLIDQHPEWLNSNILTGCFKELGRIAFFKDKDLEKSLSLTNQAIDHFVDNGERCYLKSSCLISKALYLEKLDRNEESMQVLLKLWKEIGEINDIVVILLMYELRAILLSKRRQYLEATQFAKTGLEIALRNKQIERSVELFTTLGVIYMDCNNLLEAEETLLSALQLENNVTKEHLLVSTYTKLGELYLKQENWNEAAYFLSNAVKIGSKTNDILRYIEALETMGDFYLKQDNHDIAIDPYDNALQLAEKHNFPSLKHSILIKLGHCYKYSDKEKYRDYMERLFEFEVELKLREL